MEQTKVLTAVGVSVGNVLNGMQFYQVVGKDENGMNYLSTFAVKMCYTDAAEKTFKRMFPIPAPEQAVVDETATVVNEVKKELSEYEKLLLED